MSILMFLNDCEGSFICISLVVVEDIDMVLEVMEVSLRTRFSAVMVVLNNLVKWRLNVFLFLFIVNMFFICVKICFLFIIIEFNLFEIFNKCFVDLWFLSINKCSRSDFIFTFECFIIYFSIFFNLCL